MPKEKLEEEMLTREFKLALDNHEIQKAKKAALKLRSISNDPYLLWQFQIALAYLEHTENELTVEFKKKIVNEINQNDNWTENIDVLRLFTNSMQILSVERVDAEMSLFFHRVSRSNNISESMQERYAIVCDNYLHFLFDRCIRCGKNYNNSHENVKSAINYLCDLESTAHLMIYKVTGTYYKYIFDKKFDDAKKIRQELLSLGCTAGVKNWPI